jgi:polyisoprenoid-binding protein YceI
MQRSAKLALIASVGVVVLGGFAFWYFALRGDAQERASIDALTTGEAPTEQTSPAGGEIDPEPADTLEGEWAVAVGDDVFAGYRILELFAGDTIKKEAAGRTPAVTGTITVVGDRLTEAVIVADLEQLKSDSSRRDDTQRDSGLEIDRFPTATFRLTSPVVLDAGSAPGQPVALTAEGDLTLHGVTRPVQLVLQAQRDGETLVVAGGSEIILADYGIEPPRTSFVNVDDVGEFEVQLRFVRG